MSVQIIKSNSLLLLTSIIWGFAFVAQRIGMDYVGPFTFNGARFALGSCSLIPLLFMNQQNKNPHRESTSISVISGGFLAGCVLFAGASLQQIGLVYTTAGKAGFITGLYIIIVPILGLLVRQKTYAGTWLGAIIATIGLYLLSVKGKFIIEFGDMLELIGAFFWAVHLQVIGWLAKRMNSLQIAFFQFITCSILSLITALFLEIITLQGLRNAMPAICYGGLLSVGVAYTLQVVAQRHAHPAHAAIILSLEAVFAVIGGRMILNERLPLKGIIGCALMLMGMLLSQFNISAASFKTPVNTVYQRFLRKSEL